MRIARHTTVTALTAAKNRHGTLDALVTNLGLLGLVSKGTLSRILRGESVSRESEMLVRHALGLCRPSFPTIRMQPATTARFDALRQPGESRAACLRRILDEKGD